MNSPAPGNEGQAALWNSVAGSAWVDMQRVLDGMFAPLATALLDGLAPDARRVLDVGCGTGATTLAIARRLGDAGDCTGVDVSAPMIGLARARAACEGVRAAFMIADAQCHGFATGAFDAIVSRLGVMFFDDPVAAFGNLHRAARTGAALRCIAWRSAAANPFMTAAECAAARWMPGIAAATVDGPGQFALADGDRARRLIEEAGWRDTAVRPLDRTCVFPASELEAYVTRLGPLGRALPSIDGDLRRRVVDAALDAMTPYVLGDEVRFNAACWLIEARA